MYANDDTLLPSRQCDGEDSLSSVGSYTNILHHVLDCTGVPRVH